MSEPTVTRATILDSLAKHPDLLELVKLLADPNLFVTSGEPEGDARYVILASPTRPKMATFKEGDGSYSVTFSSAKEQGSDE